MTSAPPPCHSTSTTGPTATTRSGRTHRGRDHRSLESGLAVRSLTSLSAPRCHDVLDIVSLERPHESFRPRNSHPRTCCHPLRRLRSSPGTQSDQRMTHDAISHSSSMAHGAMAHGATAHGTMTHGTMSHSGSMAHTSKTHASPTPLRIVPTTPGLPNRAHVATSARSREP